MKKPIVLGAALALSLGGLAVAAAQGQGGSDRGGDGPWGAFMERFSAQDREAFIDARIAAVHAGLKLSPEQEKLWPPVEEAVRGLVAQRRAERQGWRDRLSPGSVLNDAPGMLRAMADAQAARAEATRKLADALGPLYASLDEAQRRRLLVLARPLGRLARHGGMGPMGHHHMGHMGHRHMGRHDMGHDRMDHDRMGEFGPGGMPGR